MALSRQYLECLGLELVRNKYYPAAKVEQAIEEFCRVTAELGSENKTLGGKLAALEAEKEALSSRMAALAEEKEALSAQSASHAEENARLVEDNARYKERVDSLSRGCEEIGEAILSAKTISQQFITEAREQAESIVAEAEKKAAAIVAEAEKKAAAIVAEAEKKAAATVAEAEEKSARLLGDREEKLRAAEESMRGSRERIRAEYLDALRKLDGVWEDAPASGGDEGEISLPGDLGGKLGRIADELAAMDAEGE